MRWPKFIYLNPFFRLCPKRSDEDHIFVVGAPRSGTTLVSNVIANNSAVCSLGSETNIFSWHTCFALFDGKAGLNSDDFNSLRKRHRNVVDLLDELSKSRKTESGRSRFLEKTPQHVFHLGFITKHFPNAKIVNVIRDPRDAYLSSKSNNAIRQKSAHHYGTYWKKSIQARQKFIGHPSIIDIKYESLTNNPSKEFTKLMSWLELDYEESQISPSKMVKDPRAGSKEFRLLGKEISNERNGMYQKELSADEIQEVETAAGDILSLMGYARFKQ